LKKNNVNSADFLFDYFHSESSTNAWYFGGFNNSEFDTAVEAMMAAPTQEEVNNWAWECQRILWFEQPMIVCYNYVYTHAYRTGRWEGYVNMATRNRICNGYSLVHLRLKELAGGPFGCFPTEYVMSLQEGLDTTNWLMSTSEHTDKVFQLAYEELWTLSPFDLSPQPGLAYAWEIQPTVASGDIQNGEKYTFHLYENATWHDGVPVTSTDVAFSVDLALLDPYDAEKYQHIYRTNILDASTIELYTTATGYLEWLRSTGFTIYPEHIWNDIAITGGNVTTWVPIVPELVGSGPYQFTSWVPGQYVVLERHADWHFQIEHPPRTPCPPPTMDGYPLLGIPIMIILIQVCILGILLVRRSRVRSKKKWR
jgi:ABC-type transport system substrate-binding protein